MEVETVFKLRLHKIILKVWWEPRESTKQQKTNMKHLSIFVGAEGMGNLSTFFKILELHNNPVKYIISILVIGSNTQR